ncbi:MAG: translocation/assembly module TamB domain-containing protein [Chitinophagaceae bacterium]
MVRNKIASYISSKTNTSFKIGSIDYSLPKWIELNGVIMLDRNNDTLLYGNKIKANISMLKLISGRYEVKKLLLEDMYINLHKKKNDTVFNFQFIIDAFTSKADPTSSATDTSKIDLSLDQLMLKKVRFNMLDDATGSYTRMTVKDFDLKLKKLDINTLEFDIDKLYTDELRLDLIVQQHPIPANETSTAGQAAPFKWPLIRADSLVIKNSHIGFEDQVSKIKSVNDINLLEAFHFSNMENPYLYKGETLRLENSTVLFNHNTSVKTVNRSVKNKEVIDTVDAVDNLAFQVNKIYLNNNNITYNDDAARATINGIDYAHLAIKKLNLLASNTFYQNGKIESSIQNFSFADKSGFTLQSLSGYVKVNDESIRLENFVAKTPTSTLRADAVVYPMNTIGTNRNGQNSSIEITNSVISQKDIRLLANDISRQYASQFNALGDLAITARMSGTPQEMNIRELKLRSLNGKVFTVDLAGSIANITKPGALGYNLNIRNLTAERSLIAPFVKQSGQKIQLPPVINLSGTLAGNMNSVRTNVTINSAFGKATAKGMLVNIQQPATLKYDMVINATALETGKWIYQDSLLGKITGTIAAKGNKGFDIKNNNMDLKANIRSIRIQKNTYKNINLDANFDNGLVDMKANVKDPILNLLLNGNANIRNKYPTLHADIDLPAADLFALGLTPDSMVISTIGRVDINNADPNSLDAVIRLDSILVKRNGPNIYADSILLTGNVRNDSTFFVLKSPIAGADIASNLTYIQMPELLNEVVSYYMPPPGTTVAKQAPPGSITANLSLYPDETYRVFVKDLDFRNIEAHAYITNQDRDSAVKATIIGEKLTASGVTMANLNTIISGTKDSLLMTLTADTLISGGILLYEGLVKAGFANNNFVADVETKDSKQIKQYAFGVTGMKNAVAGGYDIHLKENLMLNYDQWDVNPQNQVRIAGKGFNINSFDISNSNQRLSLNSTGSGYNDPLKVDISNFQLSTITAAYNQDSTELRGLINSNFTVSNFGQTIPTMDGLLQIDSMFYQQAPIGNLKLNASANNNIVQLDGKVDGFGNNVTIAGNYTSNNIDVDINMNPLKLLTLQPFTAGNLAKSKGDISGPIKIKGPVDDPVWNGELRFNGIETIATQFGTFLRIDGQKITLTYPTINFDGFTVNDSTGNTLKVDGNLRQNESKNFISDLYLKTDQFNIMNSTAAENSMIYGKAIASVEGNLKGAITSPEFIGSAVIKNGSAITYVQENLAESLREREGVIEFIDMDTINNLLTQKTAQDLEAENKRLTANQGLFTYNINLEVEREAEFIVIVDPTTRDELRVKGSGNFNMSVNPNGTVSMSGIYNLNSGSYELNYGIINRKFILLDGSTVMLAGDPNDARLDITAAYEISTPPIDLISNEIGGSNTPASVPYKTKVPFEVLLKITGTALKPLLAFDIRIKDKAEGVSYALGNTIENKLEQLRTDESQMNKQVFALLALNRFIGDESSNFFGGSNIGNSGSLLANESVSAFLNDAIDQIAADLIKGVDIDINLKTTYDEGAGQRTDLDIGLAKTFLNDRLTVSVGKNFAIDGNDPVAKGGNNTNVQFIPDISTTYKISKDGRYLLRAYRRNQYEAILDGYFIESGIAFTLTMDYNKFREVFSKRKK